MPEIKFKHVVSFSSEDKVHKAENLIKPETYRKWKCASPGEKNATITLQFEKATQIHSIDIGNEGSAFVEILVGRSSRNVDDFQVLLVASSFMSPLESRNETHTNRVRMFGPEKLSQKAKEEKWDTVHIVCTQPFNRNMTYGLSFIKFHSPPEKTDDVLNSSEAGSVSTKLGAFSVKSDDADEDTSLKVGSWFGKQKEKSTEIQSNLTNKEAPSYAAAVLASSNITNVSPKDSTTLKRKVINTNPEKNEPPAKKNSLDALELKFIVHKPVVVPSERKKETFSSPVASKNSLLNKVPNNKDKPDITNTPNTSQKQKQLDKKNKPFNKIMEKVVFVLSGFVNPLRSQIRDKALEMGAKYKGDWDKSCTHLVCAFLHTPKYGQVRALDGKIVTKEWILDCHKKKSLLPWRDYMLGKYDKSTSEEEDSDSKTDEIQTQQKQIKKLKTDLQTEGKGSTLNGAKSTKKNLPSKPQLNIHKQNNMSKDSSETEDSDAIIDYIADTDVEDSDSGRDTEHEIEKIEKKLKKQVKAKMNSVEELSEKPDVNNLPLPELPNFFKRKHFFLFGEFSDSRYHEIKRYITAYNGVIEDYMSDDIKYVITEEKWDKNFEDALVANEDIIFINPLWIYKCHESGKLVPYQPFIVTPGS